MLAATVHMEIMAPWAAPLQGRTLDSWFAVVVGRRIVEPRSLSMIGIDTLALARAHTHTHTHTAATADSSSSPVKGSSNPPQAQVLRKKGMRSFLHTALTARRCVAGRVAHTQHMHGPHLGSLHSRWPDHVTSVVHLSVLSLPE